MKKRKLDNLSKIYLFYKNNNKEGIKGEKNKN
jgi:hypothetical protein